MCTVFLFCFFTVWLSSLVFWIEINCILPVALSGIGSHQWSGRPPAAEILKTWAASSLAWVDVRGESSSGLSLVVLFLSHRACFPNSLAPLLAFLVWYQSYAPTYFCLSQCLHSCYPYLFTSNSSGLKAKVPTASPRPKSATCVRVRCYKVHSEPSSLS